MLYFLNTPPLNEEEVKAYQKAREKYITRALSSSGVVSEQVRYIYRTLQQDMIYPRVEFELKGAIGVSMLPRDARGLHYASAYGAMVNHMAISYGVARALEDLLSDPRIGVVCRTVEGCLIDDGLPTMHLWNVVTIEGRSYHMDLAMEMLSNEQTMRYSGEAGKAVSELDSSELPRIETLIPAFKYCLVSDDVMRAEHIWSDDGIPHCLSSYIPVKKL